MLTYTPAYGFEHHLYLCTHISSRLVNASRALLQQQRPGGNAASPDRAAGGSAAAADDDADADADATVGSGGGSAPYEYGGYMLDDGTIVWSQPKHAKEKEGTTSPPSPLPLDSAFFDDGVRDESAGESEGASTSTEPVGPGDDLPKATDDEDVAAESMRDSDSDNDAGYDEQHMSTVGFLPYQLYVCTRARACATRTCGAATVDCLNSF